MSAAERIRCWAEALGNVWPLAALAVGVLTMLAWISFLGWAAYEIALKVLN